MFWNENSVGCFSMWRDIAKFEGSVKYVRIRSSIGEPLFSATYDMPSGPGAAFSFLF